MRLPKIFLYGLLPLYRKGWKPLEIFPKDAFAKIKDRYPVRLLFAGAHIEEIVSERLVKKRLQAKAYLEELYEYFKQTFNYLPFDWEQWFKLYPVHPLTIQLLHELRGLFSQHRGAIDFVYSRLKGDTKRHIPSLLNAPPSTLLSPTLIFDHFSDRLRETLETNPYYEKVYGLYKQLIPGLFPDPETQKGCPFSNKTPDSISSFTYKTSPYRKRTYPGYFTSLY
ncbi:MAG: hypothetical protein KCCBMMGE_01030 [Candidatus Methanoperedenaceae archaeon GB37]|nr:MAG: hypothetical protein KCCBMMGE_01030 [Candidatus Methanoperedenaceae archaeon GB37]